MAAASTLVRAAGLLIYRKNAGNVEYLLLQTSYEPYHWTPPKGHVDPGEDEWIAANREVHEEAGIDASSQLEVDRNFTYEMHYEVKSKPKRVTYWLALANDPNVAVILSNEHKDWKWADFGSAVALTKFDEMKNLLNKAEAYLSQNGTLRS